MKTYGVIAGVALVGVGLLALLPDEAWLVTVWLCACLGAGALVHYLASRDTNATVAVTRAHTEQLVALQQSIAEMQRMQISLSNSLAATRAGPQQDRVGLTPFGPRRS